MNDTVMRTSTPPTRPVAPDTGHPMMSLRGEIDRLFDSFFPAAFGRPPLAPDPWPGGAWRMMGDTLPAIDVKDFADHYEVAAEMPGVAVKDIAVTVDHGLLCIAGEKHAGPTGEGTGDARVAERCFGRFSRRFTLPDDADTDAVAASVDNGVLTVTVSKRQDRCSQARSIEIKSH